MEENSDSVDVNNSSVDLEHPELFSPDLLKKLLLQSNVPKEKICDLDKENLLELYRKVVLPFPQRKYKLNRRGTFLASRQKVSQSSGTKADVTSQDEKNISSSSTSSSSSTRQPIVFTSEVKKTVKLSSSRFSNGLSSDKKIELKTQKSSPGPSDRKIIKLINDTLTSSSGNSSVLKRELSENEMKTVTQEETPPPKKKHKPITWP